MYAQLIKHGHILVNGQQQVLMHCNTNHGQLAHVDTAS